MESRTAEAFTSFSARYSQASRKSTQLPEECEERGGKGRRGERREEERGGEERRGGEEGRRGNWREKEMENEGKGRSKEQESVTKF